MRAVVRRTSVLLLLGFEGAVVVLLHRLGAESWLQVDWTDLNGWLNRTAPEDALAAVIRAITLVIVYWMLATTGLYLTARLLHLRTALRAVEWATMPAVRRIVDGAVAVGIAAASIAAPVAPAVAQVPTPVVVEIDDDGRPVPPGTTRDPGPGPDGAPTTPIPPGLDRIGWTPTPAGVRATDGSPIVDTAGLHSDTATVVTQIVVEGGDHLWAISARHLERLTGEPADGPTIARYWRRVIDVNRDRLRSGDPDLIYPGETVELPPVEAEDA